MQAKRSKDKVLCAVQWSEGVSSVRFTLFNGRRSTSRVLSARDAAFVAQALVNRPAPPDKTKPSLILDVAALSEQCRRAPLGGSRRRSKAGKP